MAHLDAVRSQISEKMVYVISSDVKVRNEVAERYGYRTLGTNYTVHPSNEQNDEGACDTMVDFMFMSNATCIYQLSIYGRSGFSEWCAKIYNIPLKWVVLKLILGIKWHLLHMSSI